MKLLKKLCNLFFGTHYDTSDFVMPSKQRVITNMYRPYGSSDY